jgi:hypothetical protein
METSMATRQRNEGEGNRTAAKQYNDATTRFTKSGKVEPAAQKAKKAVDSPEGRSLRAAEEAGKRPARSRRAAPRAH